MAEASRSSSRDDLCGRKIAGKYVIESRLGGGAMGAVYKAHQTALGRTVAIKVMRTELATDPSFVSRFHREAKTASLLVHRNSINVTDFGEEPDGLLYLVMEFAAGRNLDQIIEQEAPLDEVRIVSLLSQTLSAVSVAHELGIIHRDLKPENILVVEGTDDDGRTIEVVKVCDFGVASMLGAAADEPVSVAIAPHDDHRLTAVGAIVGTPSYMSPEQASADKLDARSDLYSLGIVLFEMLTGRLPFEAETHTEMLACHINRTPPSPIAYRAVDPRLAEICLTAMKKVPSERFPDARAMRTALRGTLAGAGAFGSVLPPSMPMSRRGTEGRVSSPPTSVNGRSAITAKPPVAGPSVPPPAASITQPGVKERRTRFRWRELLGAGAVATVLGLLALRFLPSQNVQTQATLPSSQASTLPIAPTSPAPLPAPDKQVDVQPPVAPPPSAPLPKSKLALLPVPSPLASMPSSAVAPSPTLAPHADEPTATPLPAVSTAPAVAASAVPVATAAAAPTPAVPALPPPTAFRPDGASVLARVTSVNRASRSVVSSMLGRVSFDDCYRDALKRLGHGESGTGSIRLDIDEDGVIRTAVATLPPALAGASSCVAGKLRGQRLTQPPDTGGATADIGLTFTSP